MSVVDLQTFDKLVDAAIDAGLSDPDKRKVLFFRIADVAGRIPRGTLPDLQLQLDLQFLYHSIPREGIPLLLIWLQNARRLVAGTAQQDFFERLVSQIEGRPVGAEVPAPVIEQVRHEAILFDDDFLSFGYLQAGLLAGRAVARLRVPRFDDGSAAAGKRYWGTGWLLARSLMITNHHVFNARDDGEPSAGADDFRKQALATTVEFDVDSAGGGSGPVPIVDLIFHDASLDFAIARIEGDPERGALRLEPTPLTIRPGDTVPLNIIQHPNGQPKKIAIRNNMGASAGPGELRYFTSTLGGSSGAPVLNDSWKVVGLHRGSIGTKVLNFQGRTTAMVNLGTQISAILAALPATLRAEIA